MRDVKFEHHFMCKKLINIESFLFQIAAIHRVILEVEQHIYAMCGTPLIFSTSYILYQRAFHQNTNNY